jgi:hypothetical protein
VQLQLAVSVPLRVVLPEQECGQLSPYTQCYLAGGFGRVTERAEWLRGGNALDDSAGIPTTFRIVPEHSALLVRARSNVGPISFGTSSLSGEISCKVGEGSLGGLESASGRLEIQALSLVSGNALYDAEIHRRIDARRHPTISVELTSAAQVGDSQRFLLGGRVVLRDITQSISGAVSAQFTGPECLLFTGEHALDIRDFRIEVPSTLMLKIYPEVTVEMHLEACAG